MGRRADLPASALDDREGGIYRPLAGVVSSSSFQKNKKNSFNINDSTWQG
nr:MAG TPA: hypothetical protein [Caudoviricetes sp.]